MSNKIKEAQNAYKSAVDDLQKFCENNTDLAVEVKEEEYPLRVQFLPKPQLSLFENENITEDGEICDLTVTCGLSTSVKSTLRFKMDSKLLKKIIKLAEKVGALYYHAYREQNAYLRGACAALGISEEGDE